MAYSTSRLTLYALLSAIEQDMRDIIINHLSSHPDIPGIIGLDVYQKSLARFQREMEDSNPAVSLSEIIIFTDFLELYEIINRNRRLFPEPIVNHFRSRNSDIIGLAPIRNRVAHTRPLNFEDLPFTTEVVERLQKDTSIPWLELRRTISRLRDDPSYLFSLEPPFEEADFLSHKHNLPLPDFDETGFIGRKKYLEEVKKACMTGPYPVITIIGEGGVGKTALALEAAYDILQEERSPFDAVVWTSSRTAQLTPQEIIRIESAICDSVGLFRDVAEHLGAKSTPDDPFREILDYLKEFKILLVLDNLETVLDDRIREFLGKMPIGSKVLITSRIGLGAFEYRVALASLEEDEAVLLLRAMARSRQMSDLTAISNKKLAEYSGKMKNNPGFIKWFVSAVQAGKRPEEVLANPDMFLDYCMSNVYQYLHNESKIVLRTMHCVAGPLSQAELAFLSSMDVPDIQRGVAQLLTTSMLETTRSAKHNSYETRYELSSLARSYLSKKHPPSSEELKQYIGKRKELTFASQQLKADHQNNPYSAYAISLRSPGDALIGKYLIDALSANGKGNHELARELVAKASKLAPGYFEVSRVEAWIETEAKNYSAAKNAYETAVEIEPDSAPLRLWYGGFLMRCLDDLDGAYQQLKIAKELDPKSFDIALESSRLELYLKNWINADKQLSQLQSMVGITERDQRRVYDLWLQCYQRSAQAYFMQHDTIKSLEALEGLKLAYESIPGKLRDNRMRQKVVMSETTLNYLIERIHLEIQDAELLERANIIRTWTNSINHNATIESPTLASVVLKPSGMEKVSSGKIYYGIVQRIYLDHGFVREDRGESFFFHRTTSLSESTSWHSIAQHDRVSFTLAKDTRRSDEKQIAKNLKVIRNKS